MILDEGAKRRLQFNCIIVEHRQRVAKVVKELEEWEKQRKSKKRSKS